MNLIAHLRSKDYTFREIGKILGLSPQWVCQAYFRAIHGHMRPESLDNQRRYRQTEKGREAIIRHNMSDSHKKSQHRWQYRHYKDKYEYWKPKGEEG